MVHLNYVAVTVPFYAHIKVFLMNLTSKNIFILSVSAPLLSDTILGLSLNAERELRVKM